MTRKIERFEDLIAWQKDGELTRVAYQVSRRGAFAKDFGLSGKIQRAAISIMANIAEGFERGWCSPHTHCSVLSPHHS